MGEYVVKLCAVLLAVVGVSVATLHALAQGPAPSAPAAPATNPVQDRVAKQLGTLVIENASLSATNEQLTSVLNATNVEVKRLRELCGKACETNVAPKVESKP